MKTKSLRFVCLSTSLACRAVGVLALLCAVSAYSATFTWDGGGADGKFSTIANWNPDGAVTVNGNDIIFGTLVSPFQANADVDVSGNWNSCTFANGASAMTITASGNSMQFASGTANPIINNSTPLQTFNCIVRQFWITGTSDRSWSANSGNLSFTQVYLRPDSIVANNVSLTLNGAKDGSISGNITYESAFTGKTVQLIKSGAGTWTVSGTSAMTGGASITAGQLKIGNGLSLGTMSAISILNQSPAVNVSGGTLDLNAQTISYPLTFSGGALANSSSSSSTISAGNSIQAIAFTAGGSAIPGTATLTFTGGSGNSLAATPSYGLTTASLTSVTGGTGYITGDKVNITGGGSTTAAIAVVTASGGVITGISSISSPGAGYTTAPTGATKNTSTSGAGTLTVNGGNANNFTVVGATVTTAGSGYTTLPTVGISSGSGFTATAVPTSQVNVTAPTTISGSGDINIAATILGTGSITKSGVNKLTLSGANIYTGQTTLSGGTLSVVSLNYIASGTLSPNTSSSLGKPTTSANGTIGIGATAAGTLLYTGTGETSDRVIDLAGTTTGATIDQSGASGLLKFSSDLTATGAGAKTLTLQGSLAGIGEIGGKIVDSSSGATAVTKAGTGTWTLSGANTYSGATTVSGGTLQLGPVGSATAVTIANPSFETPTVSGWQAQPSGASWTFNSAGAGIDHNSGTWYTAPAALGNQAAFIQNAGPTISQSVTVSSAGLYIISFQAEGRPGALGPEGVIVRVDGVTVGTWTAAQVSQTQWLTYMAGVNLTAGSHTLLFLGNNNVGGDKSVAIDNVQMYQPTGSGTLASATDVNLSASGATLDLLGSAQTIGSLAGVAGSSVLDNGSLTAGGDNATTAFAGVISGIGTLTKTGIGILTLSGANTYSGGTTVSAGTLALSGSGTLGSTAGALTMAGGTLDMSGKTVGVSALNGYGTVKDTVGSGSLTPSANSSASGGTLNLQSGTLTYNGSATGTPTGIAGGGTLNQTGGTMNSGTYFSVGNGGSGTANLNISGGTFNNTGELLNGFQSPGTLTVSGTASLSLNFLSWGDATTHNVTMALNGGTIALNNFNNRVVGGSPAVVSLNGTLLQAKSTQAGFMNAAANLTAKVSTGGALFDSQTYDITITAPLLHDSGLGGTADGGLSKQGAGSLTLTGVNTFTGGLTISSGTLKIGGAGQLNSGSYSASILDSSTLNYASSANQTLSGSLTGTGTLNVTGTGKLTLSSACGFSSGAITIADNADLGVTLSGSSQLSPATLTVGSASAGATLEFNNVNGTTAPLAPTSIIQHGPTTLTVNSASGGFVAGQEYKLIQYPGISAANYTLNAVAMAAVGVTGTLDSTTLPGTLLLNVTQVADIWTGAASANWNTTAVNWGGAALGNSPTAGAYNDGDRVLFDDTVGAGFTSLTVAVPVGPLAVSFNNSTKNYTITSSGANLIADKAGTQTPLSKGGTGTVTLTGPNTYSGGTTLLAGQLNINSSSSSANSAIGTGALTISGGTLDNTSSTDVTLLPNNAQNWNGDFTYAGSVHNLNLGTGAVTLGGNRNVTVSGNTLTVGGIISGSTFGLTKLGAGTLTLSGANSYTGGTTISAGTLSIASIANGGSNSSIGASANLATNLVFGGGTLSYTGSSASSDRSFTIASATTATIATANNLTLSGSAPTTTGYLKNTGNGTLTLDPGAGNGYSVGCLSANGGSLVLKSGTFTTTGIDPFNTAYVVGAGAQNGGDLVVNGATLTITGSGLLKPGAAANGNLDIQSGTVNAATICLGHNGTVLATQSGGSVNATTLYHQDGGIATNTMTGGTLTVQRIYNTTPTAGAYFTFIMNGGIVRAAASTANLFDNSSRTGPEMTVQLGTNGATIDTSLSSATILRPLDNLPGQAGQLTKIGANTLTLATNNTYTGNTTISGGTLALSGSGSIATTPKITIATNATLDVTAVTGTSYANPSGRTLAFNIDKTGGTLTQGQFAIGGINLAYGGPLTVTKSGTDVLANADTFTLVTTTGGNFSGWFSSVTLPALSTSIAWDTNKLATTGVLDIYNFSTAPLAFSTLMNTPAVISALKTGAQAASVRGTPVAVSASQPSYGTATVSAGALTYTPTSGYTGSDNFTVTYLDGHGLQTMTVTVTVNAHNVGPTLSGVDDGNGYYKITTSGMSLTLYDVQAQTTDSNVTGDWTTISTATAAANGVVSWTDSELILAHQMRIYRLKQH